MVDNEKSQYEKVPTKEVINDEIPASYGYGIRHIQAALLLLCMSVTYSTRAHIGVTVVAMTKHNIKPNMSISNETIGLINDTSVDLNVTKAINIVMEDITETSAVKFVINNTKLNKEIQTVDSMWNVYRTYDWDKPIQEMILDAFYLGYFVMMFPMGMICQRFGGKIPLQISLLLNGVICLLAPTAAVWGGWKAVAFSRLLQGLTQSGLYPSCQTMLSKWVPIAERASFIGTVYTGSTLGAVLAFQIGGTLASSSAGWPATFWFLGLASIASFVLITVFGAATPSDHKTISVEEKNYILGRRDDGIKKRVTVPWKEIFKSKHVWGTFATHCASGVCFVFLFTQMPTYMHYILGFNIKNSGLLSSLPYIANIFISIGFGYVSDYCINKGFITLKTARIYSNTLAQAVPALCLVAVTFTDNSTFAVILLVLGVGLYSGVHTGWMVNYIDLSPNFSGTLMAIGNTISNFSTLSQPFLISNIVTNVRSRSQWRTMMFIMACIIFVCNAVFCWFVSAEVQPWDQNESKVPSELEEEKK